MAYVHPIHTQFERWNLWLDLSPYCTVVCTDVVFCRDIQNELVADVLLHILHVYQTSIEQHLTQPLALQYMFDLWYLNGLLLWKNSQKVKIYS